MLEDNVLLYEFNSETISNISETKVIINHMMQCSSKSVFLNVFYEVVKSAIKKYGKSRNLKISRHDITDGNE